MVKLIIDFLGGSLSDEILFLNNTILLISPTCHLPEATNHKFKELNDLDSQLHQGNFIFRTSDDCLRGLILGKLTEKFPQILIYSSRPEVLTRYLPDAKIESWPNNLESYKKIEGSTLVGPPPSIKHQEVHRPQVMLQMQNRNEPKVPQRSSSGERLTSSRILNPSKVSDQSSNSSSIPSSSNPFASQSAVIQRDSANLVKNPAVVSSSPYFANLDADPNAGSPSISNPGQSKPSGSPNFNQFPGVYVAKPSEPQSEDPFDDPEERMSDECFKNYLEIVFFKFMDNPEIRSVTCYKELHLLVQRIIREIGEKDVKIIENDLDRFKIQKETCFKILEFGFYTHQSGYSYRDMVESPTLNIPLTFTS